MITKENTFADVVKQYPQTIRLLNDLHLDYCCGGDHTLAQGVVGKDVNLDELLTQLNAIAEKHRTKTVPLLPLSTISKTSPFWTCSIVSNRPIT